MEEKTSYIQIYAYVQDSQELLQVNTFTTQRTLLMQTYLRGEDLTPEPDMLLFELDYPVQEDKYLSLKRSLDNNFDQLSVKREDREQLQIKTENRLISKSPQKEGEDPLFERLFDKFTRIVTYSSIPSG